MSLEQLRQLNVMRVCEHPTHAFSMLHRRFCLGCRCDGLGHSLPDSNLSQLRFVYPAAGVRTRRMTDDVEQVRALELVRPTIEHIARASACVATSHLLSRQHYSPSCRFNLHRGCPTSSVKCLFLYGHSKFTLDPKMFRYDPSHKCDSVCMRYGATPLVPVAPSVLVPVDTSVLHLFIGDVEEGEITE